MKEQVLNYEINRPLICFSDCLISYFLFKKNESAKIAPTSNHWCFSVSIESQIPFIELLNLKEKLSAISID